MMLGGLLAAFAMARFPAGRAGPLRPAILV